MHDQQEAPEASFFAFIPAYVLHCKEIDGNAKILYAHITALTKREGYCWATNAYLASLFDVDERTIRRWLEDLIDHQFIEVDVNKSGFQTIRKIWIMDAKKMLTKGQICPPPRSDLSAPPDRNVRHIDTKIETDENTTPNGVVARPRETRPEPPPKASKIYFNPTSGDFEGLTEKDLEAWREAYPGVDVSGAIKRCREWCKVNLSKVGKRKNHRKTVTNWLNTDYQRSVDKSVRQAASSISFQKDPNRNRLRDAQGNIDDIPMKGLI